MILLKELRTEKGLTQTEVATKLNISRQVYANYENEINQPDCKMLINLAKFFEVSIDYLLGLEDDFGTPTATPMGDAYSSDEREILQLYRELSPYLKGLTLDTMRNWATKGASNLHKKA